MINGFVVFQIDQQQGSYATYRRTDPSEETAERFCIIPFDKKVVEKLRKQCFYPLTHVPIRKIPKRFSLIHIIQAKGQHASHFFYPMSKKEILTLLKDDLAISVLSINLETDYEVKIYLSK